ncbi:snRNA-activating protein complex subunit 4 isoform X1 [Callorhinchus milii]|uniref:snRNA-activating protein complex subunit 4 isoform X1 n=2 Tax=Callorhinchus milii TaxID=7868 RepID=UPI001C3FD3F6|nr:snRNA-activating protein complex subunit 4 isoform X1 [Callorhinchus milii]
MAALSPLQGPGETLSPPRGPGNVLVTERERLCREILELEKSLEATKQTGVAIGDLDFDEEAEEEDEEVEHASGGEGPSRGVASQPLDSDTDEEDNLPVGPETCLQLNLVYQEVIMEKLQEVEKLVAQNKEQQLEIKGVLGGRKAEKSTGPSSLYYLGHFMKPYFKDKVSGLGPPSNADTKEKAKQGIKSFADFLTVLWKPREEEKLLRSIVNDSLQHLLQPKLSRLDYVNKKLELAKVESAKQMFRKQIKEVEREMHDINQLGEQHLLGNRYDEHDWMKISNIDFDGTRKAEDIRCYWQNHQHPIVNKSKWSSEEVQKLEEIAQQHNYLDWETIAKELKTQRTAYMCLQKYQESNKELRKRKWTEEEDQMLRDLVERMRVGNFIPYTKMAYFMEGRNASQLHQRWTKKLDPELTHGAWSPWEDDLLLKAVEKYGCQDWYKIRDEVPGRNDVQCRDRYIHGLNDKMKKGKWDAEEVQKLGQLLEKHGVGQWSKIAADLSLRSASQCNNKWRWLVGIKTNRFPRKPKKKKTSATRPRPAKVRAMESSSESEVSSGNISLHDSEEENVKPKAQKRRDTSEKNKRPKGQNKGVVSEEEEDEDVRLQELNKGMKEENVQPHGQKRSGSGSEFKVLDIDLWMPITEDEGADNRAKSGVKKQMAKEFGRSNPSPTGRATPPVSTDPGANVPPEELHQKQTGTGGQDPAGSSTAEPAVTEGCPAQADECPAERARKKPGRGTLRAIELERNLNQNLVKAVVPWLGRSQLLCGNQSKAQLLRQRLEAGGIKTTPVFALLLLVFRIDQVGCKKMIEERSARLHEAEKERATEKRKFLENAQAEEKGKEKAKESRAQLSSPITKKNINLGNGKHMEINKFPVNPTVPKERLKTVMELLYEKRKESRAKARAREREIANLQCPLVIMPQQPPLVQTVVLPQQGVLGASVPSAHSQPLLNLLIENRDSQRVTSARQTEGQQLAQGAMSAPTVQGTSQLPAPPTQLVNPEPQIIRHGATPGQPWHLNPCPTENSPTVYSKLQVPAPNVQQPQPQASRPPAPLPPQTQMNQFSLVLTPQGLVLIPVKPVTRVTTDGISTPAGPGPPLSHLGGAAMLHSVTPSLTAAPLPPTNVLDNSAGTAASNKADQRLRAGVRGAQEDTEPGTVPSTSRQAQPVNTSVSAVSTCAPAGNAMQLATGNIMVAGPDVSPTNPSLSQPSSTQHPPAAQPAVPPSLDSDGGARQPEQRPHGQEVCKTVGGLITCPDQPEGSSSRPAGKQPPAGEAPVQFSLLFHNETEARCRNWLRGRSGVPLAGVSIKLPYLPPFVGNMKALANLLLQKKNLEQNVSGFWPSEQTEVTGSQGRVEMMRGLVQETLRSNPGYHLLKARFLSAFTFPAFLASLPAYQGPSSKSRLLETKTTDERGEGKDENFMDSAVEQDTEETRSIAPAPSLSTTEQPQEAAIESRDPEICQDSENDQDTELTQGIGHRLRLRRRNRKQTGRSVTQC